MNKTIWSGNRQQDNLELEWHWEHACKADGLAAGLKVRLYIQLQQASLHVELDCVYITTMNLQ